MNKLLLRSMAIVFVLLCSNLFAQLQPIQNVPLNGTSYVYGSSTYIAWYFNGYEAGLTVELQVSTNSDMSSPFVNATGLTGLTYEVTGLTEGETYYWRVRSKSSGGSYSAWTGIWSFTVSGYGGGVATPLIPQLNIPLNEFTITSSNTTLAWYLNGSSVGLTYHVQVSESNTFASFFAEDSGLTDFTYDLSGLVDGSTYYWRVRSKNSVNSVSNWSTTFSFDVDSSGGGGATTPLVPQLNTPINQSTIASTTTDLAWYFNGASAGLTYHVQVSVSNTFSTFFVNDSGLTDYTYNLTGLVDGSTYYWRVRSKNSVDSISNWSSTFSFDIDLGGGSSGGTIWYVDSANGNNANSGKSLSDPLLTIQAAIDSALDGQKIYVNNGTYIENLNVGVNVEIKSIQGADSTQVIIGDGIVFNVTANSVVIDGFLISHPSFDGLEDVGILVDSCGGVVIKNNKFVGNAAGVELLNAWDNSILTNTFDQNAVGVYLEGTTDGNGNYDGGLNGPFYSLSINNLISGNTITNSIDVGNSGFGIYLDAACDTNTFIDNTISSNGSIGYYQWKASSNTITNNLFDSNVKEGIQFMGCSYNTITGNTISGNGTYGIWLRSGALSSANNTITGNTITTNDYGIYLSDDVNTNNYDGDVTGNIINFNSILDNTTYGVAISDVDTTIVNAENNWWGEATGPFHATTNAGGLGNPISDYIDYDPWLSALAPTLDIEDASSSTGATVSLDVTANLFSDSLNYTLTGSFTYEDTKLDFLSGTVGASTLLNGAGWSAVFYESSSGVVNFVAYGFSPVYGNGTLFTLSFTVIAGASGSTTVTGNYNDFLGDGTNLFGTSGSFEGEVTYTYSATPSTVKGDADLDFAVDFDDILLMAQHVGGAVTLSGQAFTNADVDSDSDIDADDIAETVNFIINGTWSPAPSPIVASEMMAFDEAVENTNNGIISLPFSVTASNNQVQSVELLLAYDENELDYQAFKGAIEGNQNFVHATKLSDGFAKFVFASSEKRSGDFELGSLVFKKGSAKLSSKVTTIYKINGGSPQAGPSYDFNGVTSIEENLPTKFEITQNYPNPFNPSTTINYSLPKTAYVTIKVYNMLGQEVKTLVNKEETAGKFSITWNGDNNYGSKVASGTYIYQIMAGEFVQAKKMILLK